MVQKNIKSIILIVVILATAASFAYIAIRTFSFDEGRTEDKVTENLPDASEDGSPILSFDKSRYPLDQPGSIWVVVNKKRPLPADFVPSRLITAGGVSLQDEAAKALEQLMKDSAREQTPLRLISGYRSYTTQQNVYNSYIKKDGQVQADTYSARPGYSEHQTGLAADLGNGSGQCDLEVCFAGTKGGIWLESHAHTYGFTIRYPETKTDVTGYQYEPWHIRYVGVDLANELRSKGQTMEEFFGLPAAPGY